MRVSEYWREEGGREARWIQSVCEEENSECQWREKDRMTKGGGGGGEWRKTKQDTDFSLCSVV